MPLTPFKEHLPNLCKRLLQTKASGHTGQAYLIVGDDIDYIEKFAMAWARTAACTEPNADGSACGHCPACKRFLSNAYPDLTVVRPQSKSRQIKVEDMREFEHILSLAANPGFLKIGMVVEAERLNDASQNAFLKTLEEPPKDTMLLLLSINPRMLLPTTKSRCQTISLLRNRQDYSSLAEQGLFKVLATLHRQAGASVGIRAAGALSNILAAQRQIAAEYGEANRDSSWDNVDDAKMRKLVEEENMAREEAEYVRLRSQVTDAIQAWYMQELLIAYGADESSLPNPEMLKGVNSPRVSSEEALQNIRYVSDFLRSLSANVDEKLALDALCLSISEKVKM